MTQEEEVLSNVSLDTRASVLSNQSLQNSTSFRRASFASTSLPSSTTDRSDFSSSRSSMVETKSIVQDYNRYRSARCHPYSSHLSMALPCYSMLTRSNDNDYSRYRDARSTQKKSSGPRTLHYNCRTFLYNNEVERFPIPDTKVPWQTIFPDYQPIEYTTERIQRNPRADPIDPSQIKFNQLDDRIDRRSFTGPYHIDATTNRPQNPIGRTGITGRGRLYYWGPNHAGDPIVTRWARDENGSIIYRRNHDREPLKPVLEFVAIQRRDTGQWAFPGGMVDPGEDVAQTVKREFQEEAARDGVDLNKIDELFSHGEKIYEWYVDDPRNTDNAWIETVAIHYHDETGELTKNLRLHAGDDAEKVVWCPIDRNLQLYASHKDILRLLVDRLGAFW